MRFIISTPEEHDRSLHAKEEAGRWFADATKAQAALFNLTMADISPYKGSPRWDRAAEAARKAFEGSTAGARAVADMVERDIMETGEIRESTSYAYDALMMGEPPAVTDIEQRNAAFADFLRANSLETAIRNSRVAEPLRSIINSFSGARA
jgi:hypothetical protein